MAAVLQPIQDVIAKLATLQVTNGDGKIVNMYTRVWNGQIKLEEEGKLYDFPKPAAFLEVINEAQYNELGLGFQSCDIGFRVHLVHEYYNADGTFEQDLAIFALRDSVIALLNLYAPTACGPMVKKSETQDYEHTNIYHYMIDFITHFIDSKGSKYDPARGDYVDYGPPTGLNLVVTEQKDGQAPQKQFRIPQ
jgi:hypothetical protein